MTCNSVRVEAASSSPVTVLHGLNHSRPEVSADAGCDTVRDKQGLIEGKEGGQFRLVGLELVERRPDGCVLIRRVLEFHDAQRQAVEEEHDVRAARITVIRDAKLVDGEPIICLGIVEIDRESLRAADPFRVMVAVSATHPYIWRRRIVSYLGLMSP